MIAGEEGLRESAAAEQAPLDQGRLATPSSGRADPGGRIVWAKVGAYPWWPAKVLNPGKDASFPPDEEPPRPNAIPVRFFGTYDFSWLGSKRAIMDWEEVGRVMCGRKGNRSQSMECSHHRGAGEGTVLGGV